MKSILRINTIVLVLAVVISAVILIVINETSLAQGLSVPQSTNEPYTGPIEQNPIIKWINFFVNVVSVIIVAGSAVMIAVAGVQYTASRDNPQAVQAAKQRIWNVAIGLVAYFFLYAFMQWLVPGGVF